MSLTRLKPSKRRSRSDNIFRERLFKRTSLVDHKPAAASEDASLLSTPESGVFKLGEQELLSLVKS